MDLTLNTVYRAANTVSHTPEHVCKCLSVETIQRKTCQQKRKYLQWLQIYRMYRNNTGRVCEGGVLKKTLRVIAVARWQWWPSGYLAAPCSCWGAGSLWGGNRDHALWRRNRETAAPKGHQVATIFQSALGGRSDREEGLAVPEITAEDKRQSYSVLNLKILPHYWKSRLQDCHFNRLQVDSGVVERQQCRDGKFCCFFGQEWSM